MTATAVETTTAVRRAWMPPGVLVAAVGGPVLLAVTNALVDYMHLSGDVGSTADELAQAARFPVLNQVQAGTGLLATLLMVPAIWGVTALLSGRSPRLAAVGGWLMASAYVFFTALSIDSLTLAAIAAGGQDPAGFVDALDNHTSVVTMLMYAVVAIGALLGGLVLGIAMLRQGGAVPAWAGWALIASEPVRVAGLVTGIPFLPAVASVLIAVAFAGALLARGLKSLP